MILLSTLTLAIAAINPTGDSEYDTTLNLGERYYIGDAATAGSEGSWYFKPGIAYNVVDDAVVNFSSGGPTNWHIEFETSNSFSLGFGVHLGNNLRLEFGYFASENDIKGSAAVIGSTVSFDQDTFSLMGLLDFHNDSDWTPFIGVGVVTIDAELAGGINTVGDPDDDDWTVGICAGFTWELGNNMDFTAEYRMTQYTLSNLDGSNVDVDNNTILLGLNWKF